jgi:peptidoglycan/xylan/chitin deacetylase (PgdA/CDA1 family)
MGILEPLRAANRYLKAYRKAQMSRRLSAVRRIERVFPPQGQLVVAMTFDDGPTASPARPGDGRGLTTALLDTMAAYGAHGTFDVIGTTADNYPDTEGRLGGALWSGRRYDHYPEFGRDELAGVVNQPDLVQRMLAEGHELANHGYNHIAFGPSRIVYGSRGYLPDSEAVYQDLKHLHDVVQDRFGYTIRLSRPPHYIDGIRDGHNSYDVYGRLGYNYLAASFDGGGWKPSSGDYKADVTAMVDAVRRSLLADPAALNGQIIFQKDGYNMSKESPIVDALPLQLELLKSYGYRVITVSELMALAPFTDVDPTAPYAAGVAALARAGHCCGFRDNSFQPERPLTQASLSAWLAGPWAEPARDAGNATQTVTARQLTAALPGQDAGSLLALLPQDCRPDEPIQRGWAAQLVATALGLR